MISANAKVGSAICRRRSVSVSAPPALIGQGRGDRRRDRPDRDHRGAEVATQGLEQEVPVLDGERLVEAETLAQRDDAGRARLVAEDHQDGIARQDPDDQEDQRQDAEQCDDGEAQTPRQE